MVDPSRLSFDKLRIAPQDEGSLRDVSLPLEGRVAAKRSGGVVAAGRHRFACSTVWAVPSVVTPSAPFGGTSPSRGEEGA
jgi:cobaltochelatase CobN